MCFLTLRHAENVKNATSGKNTYDNVRQMSNHILESIRKRVFVNLTENSQWEPKKT